MAGQSRRPADRPAPGGTPVDVAAPATHEPVEDPAAPEAEQTPAPVGRGQWWRGPGAALAALVLAAALLAVVVGYSLQGTHSVADDRAAVEAARTSLEKLLSYDHSTIEAQLPHNQDLLTGPFRDEYAKTLRDTVIPMVTKDKVVVQARSYDAGVMSRDGNTIKVQVFVNQVRTTAAQPQAAVDQNRAIATMTKVGGRWLISGLQAY